MKFSILVPTFNEEKDILRTLTALEHIDYSDYEVIVVDGRSKDRTIPIIETFTKRLSNFHLLLQPESNRKGVAEARNIGVKAAKGEVLVILNADVLLPQDFLKKIEPYYKQGNHWVAVLSKILNRGTKYSRHSEAAHYYLYMVKGEHWVWTEGFSCTKEAAIAVGMFPDTMPGFSGEDGEFGLELERKFKGVRAPEIIVPHISPDELGEFFWQHKARGKGRTNCYFYMKHYGKFKLFINSVLSTGWRFLKMIVLVPVRNAWLYSAYSERGRKDFLSFIGVDYVKEWAMIVGMWNAYKRILKVEKKK